jgi:dimethylglycine catabolism A
LKAAARGETMRAMWRPEHPVKHRLLAARWPTVDEAARSRLYSPCTVGPLTLSSRTWVPAMVPWRATEDGEVTRDVLDWYARFAEGRPGAIVVEATGVRDVPSGPLLRIGHDRFMPGLTELTRVVERASGGATKVLIQLIDFLAVRRRPEPARFFERFLVLTERHRALTGIGDEQALRAQLAAAPRAELERVLDERELEALDRGHRERVTDLQLPHVRELPERLPTLFADAAVRAEHAGFHGVELHYAHAYTMASFLSRTNTRDDGYGSTLDGRLRLPLEVIAATRARLSSGFALGARFLADECITGGSDVLDAETIAVALARAGLDFLSLSRGGKFDDAKQPAIGSAVYPYTGRSGHECMPSITSDAQGPFGRNVAASERVRRVVRAAGFDTPIVVAGGIATFDQAEAMLNDGVADIIASARQSLADPDWFLKARQGRGAEIRRCEFTNYCEGLDQKHKQVTCKLWDRVDLDTAPTLSHDGRRRLTPPPWSAR